MQGIQGRVSLLVIPQRIVGALCAAWQPPGELAIGDNKLVFAEASHSLDLFLLQELFQLVLA